jgi:hypothetical protein
MTDVQDPPTLGVVDELGAEVAREEERPAPQPPAVVDRQPDEEGLGEESLGRRAWALLAFDPATGCATTIVAIAGVDGDGGPGAEAVSWVPLVGSADQGWRERLTEARGEPLAVIVERAAEAGGIAVDIQELAPPEAADLRGAVEVLMDEVLASVPEEGGR